VLVISYTLIQQAYSKHSEWRASLDNWYRIASDAKWEKFLDVRQTYKSADAVGDSVVFDIANNKCRLITKINYKIGSVVITGILTHQEYDKGGW
jgi:mRNA interferase HigB